MTCDEVWKAFAGFEACEQTSRGARFVTHCLYPSFEPVSVYVVRHGRSGYIVHDGGDAAREIDLHDRGEKLQDRALKASAKRFGANAVNGHLKIEIADASWLRPAILTVANAASHAAYIAIEYELRRSENETAELVYEQLVLATSKHRVSREIELRGRSGRSYQFDFGVSFGNSNILPVEIVISHPSSVTAKYVALSDTMNTVADRGIAAHRGDLVRADQTLLADVAILVPAEAVGKSIPHLITH
ncbi:MAG: hypothetical protein ACFE0P_07335 [Oceanicaulis sp.]